MSKFRIPFTNIIVTIARRRFDPDYESGPSRTRESAPIVPLTSTSYKEGDARIYRVIRRLIDEGVLLGRPRTWAWDIVTESVNVQYPALALKLNDRTAQG